MRGISLDNLEKVSGDLSFISNTFTELGLGTIDEIGGTLTLTKNTNLEKLGLPKLRRLGGALSLSDNSALASIQAFPNLEEVDGTLDITGAFDEVQLPKLNDVRISYIHSEWSAVILICFLFFVGTRWPQRSNIKQQVFVQ